jgi:hypothetical protein
MDTRIVFERLVCKKTQPFFVSGGRGGIPLISVPKAEIEAVGDEPAGVSSMKTGNHSTTGQVMY